MEPTTEFKPQVNRLESFKRAVRRISDSLQGSPLLLGGVAVDRLLQGQQPTSFEQLPPELQIGIALGGLILGGGAVLEVASRIRAWRLGRRLGPRRENKTTGLIPSTSDRPLTHTQPEYVDPIARLNRQEITDKQKEERIRDKNRGRVD